jgi:Na+-driven multidrug efflux pump
LHVRARHLRLAPATMKLVLRISSTAMLQVFVGMASWIGMVRTISGFGNAALAGYTIGIRVIVFALLPANGLANAAATMVGQALGAKKPERAAKAVWAASAYDVAFLGAVGVLLFLLAPEVAAIFTADAETVAYAVDCLRIVAIGFPFFAYAMVLGAAFNGAGDTWTPTWINLGVFWAFEIPAAYLLAHRFGYGPRGVFVAILTAFTALAAISALLFRRGTWKARVV